MTRDVAGGQMPPDVGARRIAARNARIERGQVAPQRRLRRARQAAAQHVVQRTEVRVVGRRNGRERRTHVVEAHAEPRAQRRSHDAQRRGPHGR